MQEKMIYNFSTEKTGTHMLLLAEVPEGNRVLDVGCASGYLGNYLIREKRCEVWGIEPDYISSEEARAHGYKAVLNRSVEEALREPILANEQFDVILIGDVLEHLVKPEQLLQDLKPFLKPGGRLVLSLPNVAHYSVRFGLLAGNWEMTETGILDRTHLHFFTRSSAEAMFAAAGWRVETVRPRGDLERWLRRLGLEGAGRSLLFMLAGFFAVQYVFTLRLNSNN